MMAHLVKQHFAEDEIAHDGKSAEWCRNGKHDLVDDELNPCGFAIPSLMVPSERDAGATATGSSPVLSCRHAGRICQDDGRKAVETRLRQ
jgi:hypothetical protein